MGKQNEKENTEWMDGITVEKLKEIDKLYLDKCEEVNRLKAYIQKLEKEK